MEKEVASSEVVDKLVTDFLGEETNETKELAIKNEEDKETFEEIVLTEEIVLAKERTPIQDSESTKDEDLDETVAYLTSVSVCCGLFGCGIFGKNRFYDIDNSSTENVHAKNLKKEVGNDTGRVHDVHTSSSTGNELARYDEKDSFVDNVDSQDISGIKMVHFGGSPVFMDNEEASC